MPALQHSKLNNLLCSNQRILPHSAVVSPVAATSRPPHLMLSPTASFGNMAINLNNNGANSKALFVRGRHSSHSSGDRQRRAFLKAHLSHITFLHPLCALLFAATSLVFFGLRLSTEQTVGFSYEMSVLVYVNHVPYICCASMGVANTLQVCGAIIGRQHKQLLSLITATRRYLGLLAVYGLFSFIILFFVRHDNGRQQLMAQLVLLLCWAPDMCLLGPLS